jgi:hypothetical protein
MAAHDSKKTKSTAKAKSARRLPPTSDRVRGAAKTTARSTISGPARARVTPADTDSRYGEEEGYAGSSERISVQRRKGLGIRKQGARPRRRANGRAARSNRRRQHAERE